MLEMTKMEKKNYSNYQSEDTKINTNKKGFFKKLLSFVGPA